MYVSSTNRLEAALCVIIPFLGLLEHPMVKYLSQGGECDGDRASIFRIFWREREDGDGIVDGDVGSDGVFVGG